MSYTEVLLWAHDGLYELNRVEDDQPQELDRVIHEFSAAFTGDPELAEIHLLHHEHPVMACECRQWELYGDHPYWTNRVAS